MFLCWDLGKSGNQSHMCLEKYLRVVFYTNILNNGCNHFESVFIFLDSEEITMDKDFMKKWKRKAAVSTFTDNYLRICNQT